MAAGIGHQQLGVIVVVQIGHQGGHPHHARIGRHGRGAVTPVGPAPVDVDLFIPSPLDAAAGVSKEEIRPPVPVDVAGGYGGGSKGLQVGPACRPVAPGFPPVHIGGHIQVPVGSRQLVGKGDLGPTVAIEIGNRHVGGLQGRQPQGRFARPPRLPPKNGGAVAACHHQVGPPVQVQIGHGGPRSSQGEGLLLHKTPRIPGKKPRLLPRQGQHHPAQTFHLTDTHRLQVVNRNLDHGFRIRPLGRARKEPQPSPALLRGGEDQVRMAVPVQISQGAAYGESRRQQAPVMDPVAVARTPVYVGTLAGCRRLSAAGIGEDDVGVAVPIQVADRQVPGSNRGKLHPSQRPKAGGVAPVDQAVCRDGVSGSRGGKEYVRPAVPVQIVKLHRTGTFDRKPDHPVAALLFLEPQVVKRNGTVDGRDGRTESAPRLQVSQRIHPTHHHVMGIAEDKLVVAVVVQVPTVNELDASASGDVDVLTGMLEFAPGEGLESLVDNPEAAVARCTCISGLIRTRRPPPRGKRQQNHQTQHHQWLHHDRYLSLQFDFKRRLPYGFHLSRTLARESCGAGL